MNSSVRRPPACEGCRHLKVLCERDPADLAARCRRCVKAKRECIVTVPTRKHRKKAETRVTELEKKIEALTASLQAQINGRGARPVVSQEASQDLPPVYQRPIGTHGQQQWQRSLQYGASASDASSNFVGSSPRKRRKLEQTNDSPTPSGDDHSSVATPPKVYEEATEIPVTSSDTVYIDVIDRDIIDTATATRIFNHYKLDMSEQLPVVRFSPTTTATDIRRRKPVLFLAILSAGSSTIKPDVQPVLLTEIYATIADRLICRGEKSLELVQALQVLTIWYQPREKYEALNFNQLMHLAAIMCIDLGIGKRSYTGHVSVWREAITDKNLIPNPKSPETRRAWMGCYFMCTSAAMSLRNPLLIRWTPYMDECLEIMATSPGALPSDTYLSHLVRAQRIAEDVGFQFSMDDPVAHISITDTKTQFLMKAFEKRLEDWRKSIEDLPKNAILNHTDAIISIYMHEIALHHKHNSIEDLKPSYEFATYDEVIEPDFITPAHIDSFSTCIESIHKAFDTFMAMGVENVRYLPTLFFARTSYAVVALMKVYRALSVKNSNFGVVFSPQDLKIGQYLDAIIAFIMEVGRDGKSRIALRFVSIMTMLRQWYLKKSEKLSSAKEAKPSSFVAERIASSPTTLQPTDHLSNAPWNTAEPFSQQQLNTGASFLPGTDMMDTSSVGLETFGFRPEELETLNRMMDEDMSWLNYGTDAGVWGF